MNYIAWRLMNALYRFTHPAFWMQNEPTCYEYDEALRRALDRHGVTRIGRHACRVGAIEIWISNYPYSFGHVSSIPESVQALPAPLTRVRLRAMISQACMSEAA